MHLACRIEEWLQSLGYQNDLQPVSIKTKSWSYSACYYRGQHVDTNMRLYVIGMDYTPRTCYRSSLWEHEWIVVGYYPHHKQTKSQPFGKNAILAPWTGERPVDANEMAPYRRIQVEIEAVG